MSFKIRTKLFAGFGIVLCLTSVIGYIGWVNTRTFSSEFSDLYANNLGGAIALSRIERAVWELRIALPAYMLGDPAAREKMKADTPKWVSQVEEGMKRFWATDLTAAEHDLLKEWDNNFPAYLRARPMYFALVDADKTAEAKEFRARETNPPAGRAVAALGKLGELQEKLGAAKEAAVTTMAARSVAGLWITLAVALALGISVAVVMSRTITRPLRDTADVLKDLAGGEGDLTTRLEVKRKDELGDVSEAFNTFMEKLHDIVSQAKGAASHVAAATHQLSAASDQLSSGAQEQASSLEETAASLEEITGTVKQNADNARQANQLAVGSRDVAEKGGQVVVDAVRSMKEINQSSKKIADIITTIDEIAFQTNLLALNAAVEAARAGEQGRGFAVVASEVRNLAQRSATAAKEIKGLIQDSVAKVEAGSELVNRSGETLTEIVGSVKRVTDIIAEIAAASQEQTTGIDQVNTAVTQLDQVTQANAAQTEQLSSTAQSLAAQAKQLQALVGGFRVRSDGRVASEPGAIGVPAVKAAPVGAGRPERRASDGKSRGPVRKTDEVLMPAVPVGSNGKGHKDDGFEEF